MHRRRRGRETTSTYDEDGNLHTQTDAYGNVTHYGCDGAGRLTSQWVANPSGQTVRETSYQYDLAGDTTEEIDGTQTVTISLYYPNGWLQEQTTSPDGGPNRPDSSVSYTYDDDGNVATETDLDGDVTADTYVDGRVSQETVTDAAQNLVSDKSYTYDLGGDEVTETDATAVAGSNVVASEETVNTYNAAGQLLTQTLGYGTSAAATTAYGYDKDGNQISVTDPDHNTTTYQFDAVGQVTSMTTPLGTTLYVYDDAGDKTALTDADGRRITYEYTAGLLTTEIWYAANGSVSDTLTWAYNQDGELVSAANAAGTYSFTYTAAGQVASVTEPWGLTLTFGYDASGNQTSVSDSLGGVETSNYGGDGELASRILTDASGTTLRVDLGYDEAGNVALDALRRVEAALNGAGI